MSLNINSSIKQASGDGNGGRDRGIWNKAGGLDEEGEEGEENDYIDNIHISHDLRWRNEGLGRNVNNTRRLVQAKDTRYPTPTTTSVQHDEDDRWRWRYKETSLKGWTAQTANRGARWGAKRRARRADLGFKLHQCTPQLCALTIRCSDQYPQSAGRCHLHDHDQEAIGRISEVPHRQAWRDEDGVAYKTT